ncbi:hypothetical protein ACQ4WX_22685 [Streptomyces lasalocidi]
MTVPAANAVDPTYRRRHLHVRLDPACTYGVVLEPDSNVAEVWWSIDQI